jgi:hypothetical protein
MWKFLRALWRNPLIREALTVIAVQVMAVIAAWG